MLPAPMDRSNYLPTIGKNKTEDPPNSFRRKIGSKITRNQALATRNCSSCLAPTHPENGPPVQSRMQSSRERTQQLRIHGARPIQKQLKNQNNQKKQLINKLIISNNNHQCSPNNTSKQIKNQNKKKKLNTQNPMYYSLRSIKSVGHLVQSCTKWPTLFMDRREYKEWPTPNKSKHTNNLQKPKK